jgi:alkylation response protein AidB-like acyl-CoA dehydrogenase
LHAAGNIYRLPRTLGSWSSRTTLAQAELFEERSDMVSTAQSNPGEAREQRELDELTDRLAPLILAAADELESRRRMPDSLVDALWEAGVFSAFTPAEVGGRETDLIEWLEQIEQLSRLNGSVGWNAFVQAGQTTLPPDAMRRILAEGRYIVASSFGRAAGRAYRVDGGYRVAGRWPFASGSPYATHFMGRSLVYDTDEKPVPNPQLGGQAQVFAVFPREDVTLHDTWDGLGLRGSASMDFEVRDAFVPEDFAGPTLTGPYSAPLFRGIYFLLLGHSAHALGIARCAIDFVEIVQRAQANTPHGSTRQRRLGNDQVHKLAIAKAESLVQAARAFTLDAASRAWQQAQRDEEVSYHLRVLMAQSMILSAHSAKEAVGLLFEQAGTSAVIRGTTLERCYRDIATAAQHTLVVETRYETIGEYYLTRSLPGGPQIDLSMTAMVGPPPPARPITD